MGFLVCFCRGGRRESEGEFFFRFFDFLRRHLSLFFFISPRFSYLGLEQALHDVLDVLDAGQRVADVAGVDGVDGGPRREEREERRRATAAEGRRRRSCRRVIGSAAAARRQRGSAAAVLLILIPGLLCARYLCAPRGGGLEGVECERERERERERKERETGRGKKNAPSTF